MLAIAGGQDEQPWLWYNSTTVGCAASLARAAVAKLAPSIASMGPVNLTAVIRVSTKS
jgi:hypothetical protein